MIKLTKLHSYRAGNRNRTDILCLEGRCTSRCAIPAIYVKMDKLYLHFTQCFPLDYHQQHRIGCFLTLLSTTLLVVTLPPLTRFIFILICTWIGFSYVTPRTTFLPFYFNKLFQSYYKLIHFLI